MEGGLRHSYGPLLRLLAPAHGHRYNPQTNAPEASIIASFVPGLIP